MTDKGMPEKIWMDETSVCEDGFYIARADDEYGNVDIPYIRADIVEELARAVEAYIFGENDITDMSDIRAALARYSAATEGE